MKLFDEHGNFHGTIPDEVVDGCSHQGSCDEDVHFWRDKLGFEVPRQLALDYLREFGAWTQAELAAKDDYELAEIVLWIACGDIQENGEWFGLICG